MPQGLSILECKCHRLGYFTDFGQTVMQISSQCLLDFERHCFHIILFCLQANSLKENLKEPLPDFVSFLADSHHPPNQIKFQALITGAMKSAEVMMGDDKASHEHILAKEMLAGGLAGTLADGLMYPMMTVKSRMQVLAVLFPV